jgi:pimeloyl-ACP methyl ester carboxylesterase
MRGVSANVLDSSPEPLVSGAAVNEQRRRHAVTSETMDSCMISASGPTVVFVHGAYHDDSCWSLVVDRLAAAGVASRAVRLPFTSFSDDCAAVRGAVRTASTRRPVLLVGHSYSGLVVSAAGHAANGLVYVAARMPAAGEIPAELTREWTLPDFQAATFPVPDGGTMLSPSAAELLYNTTDPDLRNSARQTWRPMQSKVPHHPIPEPAWTGRWTLYVVCAQDRVVSVDAQRAVAARADENVEIDSDHSPFLSAPDELTAVLIKAAAAIAGRQGRSAHSHMERSRRSSEASPTD